MAGKREKKWFEVDPVAPAHSRAGFRAGDPQVGAARADAARSLFADPEMEYREAVRFYQHDVIGPTA